jgi:hypothetical protein
MSLAADRFHPFLPSVAGGGARAHYDFVVDLNEFGGDGFADHACAEDCNFHKYVDLLMLINAGCELHATMPHSHQLTAARSSI